MLSQEADLALVHLVVSDKSPTELDRRKLPGKGVFAGDCAWINVFWTMPWSRPSFHGDKLGSGGSTIGFAYWGDGDQPKGAGVGPKPGRCDASSAASRHNGS